MTDETPTPDRRIIELTDAEYQALERAMQWPEDLPKYDRLNQPLRIDMMTGNVLN